MSPPPTKWRPACVPQTAERGLTRTLLRELVLSIAVAERAGRADETLSRLVKFLRLARPTDYVRPLARDREVSRILLRRLLGVDSDPETRDVAELMLERLDRARTNTPAFLSRGLQVLTEVRHGVRNREIAVRLDSRNPAAASV